MTTRKDLLEAQAYTRRRLLTVLVVGAPDGQPEPSSPGRALLLGVVLAVVVTLVVAVVARLAGS